MLCDPSRPCLLVDNGFLANVPHLVERGGEVIVKMLPNVQQATIEPVIATAVAPGTLIYTDEYNIYSQLPDTGRDHHTVSHSDHEWARDDDGDGIREVHCNTMEGIWTGLPNFLRPLRGVHKKYLAQYVAVFEWAYNLKHVSADFLRALMIPGFTFFPI